MNITCDSDHQHFLILKKGMCGISYEELEMSVIIVEMVIKTQTLMHDVENQSLEHYKVE